MESISIFAWNDDKRFLFKLLTLVVCSRLATLIPNEGVRANLGNKKSSEDYSGRETAKVLPRSSSLSTSTEPWCDSAASFTIDNPRPLPPLGRMRESCTR